MPTYACVSSATSTDLIQETHQNFESFVNAHNHFDINPQKGGKAFLPGVYAKPRRQQIYIIDHNYALIDLDLHYQAKALIDMILDNNPILTQFNFWAFSTYSSNNQTLESISHHPTNFKDGLRLRLLIEFAASDKFNLEDYSAATRTLEKLLNLKFDPCSHRKNTLGYAPSIPPDTIGLTYTNFTGRPFALSDIDQALYHPHDRITHEDAFSSIDRSMSGIPFTSLDDDLDKNILGFGHDTSISIIKSALSVIDPTSNDIWLAIGMALSDYFQNLTSGYEIFDEWSKGKLSYPSIPIPSSYNPIENRARWNSFNSQKDRRITIGTLFYYAKLSEWQEIEQELKSIQLLESINSNSDSFVSSHKAENFIKTILADYWSLSGLQQIRIFEAFIEAIRSSNPSDRLSKNQLERWKQAFSFSAYVETMTPEERLLRKPNFARNLIAITGLNTTRPKFIDRTAMFTKDNELILKEASIIKLENMNKPHVDKEKLAFPSALFHEYLMNTCLVDSVFRPRFSPEHPEIFTLSDGQTYINTFQHNEHFYFRPISEFESTSIQAIIYEKLSEFTALFEPNSDYRHILLNYLASISTKPGFQALWAPVLIAPQGYGKNLFIECLKIVMGKHSKHMLTIDAYRVFGKRFNGLQENRTIMLVDEVYEDVKAEDFDGIKRLITGAEGLTIERKGVDEYQTSQKINLVFLSNHKRCLPVTETERRLFMLTPVNRHKVSLESLKEKLQPYFTFIADCLSAYHREDNKVQSHLEQYSPDQIREGFLSFFAPYANPENYHPEFIPLGEAHKTDDFHEIVRSMRDPIHNAIDEIFEDSNYPWADAELGFVFLRPLVDEIRLMTRKTVNLEIKEYLTKNLKYKSLQEHLNSPTFPNLTISNHFNLTSVGQSPLYMSDSLFEFLDGNLLTTKQYKRYIQSLETLVKERQKVQGFEQDQDEFNYTILN